MDPELLLLIWAVIMSCTTVGLGVACLRIQQRARELERVMLDRLLPPEADPEDDLARQIRALADQVDRLAEGQEFLARMVADRGHRGPRLLNDLPRPVTPH